MICSAPCILVTLLEFFVCLVLGETPATLPYAMMLGFAALFLLPIGLASLILVIFAKRSRGLCLGLSTIYFGGWAVLFLFM